MSVKTTQLSNGVRIITEAMPETGIASLSLWVRTGARAENKAEHGISHLLEHMAFKGTARRSAFDIVREIEDVGGDINAATGFETTTYYAQMMADDSLIGVDILCDVILNSRFDPEEFTRESAVVEQEIRHANDTPDDLVFESMRAAAFPDQSLGRPILGTVESIARLTPEIVHRYMTTQYRGSEIILAAAGAVDHDRIAAAAAGLEALPPGTNADFPPARYSGGKPCCTRPIEQLHYVHAYAGTPYYSDDFFVALGLAQVLGGGMASRLFQEARERCGLCYSIFASAEAYCDTGLFYIYAATTPDQASALFDIVATETRRASLDLEASEVERAKRQLKVGMMMGQEHSASRAARLGRHGVLLDRIISSDETLACIDAISVDAVRSFAARLGTDDNSVISLVGADADTVAAKIIV